MIAVRHLVSVFVRGLSCTMKVGRVTIEERIWTILFLDDFFGVIAENDDSLKPVVDLWQPFDRRQPTHSPVRSCLGGCVYGRG